jgi:hypothetical protein
MMAQEVGAMKKRQILWAIVFGSMLAITGCGDDDSSNGGGAGSGGSAGSNGSAGSGGSGGSGGSNGGGNSSCEAICGGTCIFGGVLPGVGYDQCLDACRESGLDDNCGAEMTAYLDCLVDNDCNLTALDCLSQAQAWAECNDPT